MPRHFTALPLLTVVLYGCPLPDDICELDLTAPASELDGATCDVEPEDAVITIRREVDDDLRFVFRLDLSGAFTTGPVIGYVEYSDWDAGIFYEDYCDVTLTRADSEDWTRHDHWHLEGTLSCPGSWLQGVTFVVYAGET